MHFSMLGIVYFDLALHSRKSDSKSFCVVCVFFWSVHIGSYGWLLSQDMHLDSVNEAFILMVEKETFICQSVLPGFESHAG